jgi:hypothetical protein
VPFVPLVFLVPFCGSQTRDAAVAQYVVLNPGFVDQLGHLKLAQDFRRPDPMRAALADGRVVNAHEFRGGRHLDLAIYE